MGVIYKLKEGVIDFIVQQKKEIPAISCRQLAALVNQKYQTAISKSSINNILKNSQLSSPVGRRGFGEKKVKKFEIPPIKKREISAGIQKEGGPLLKNMGLVFLKAVEWEISQNFLLGDCLKETGQEGFSNFLGVMFYSRFLGLGSLRELEPYNQEGIIFLNGLAENMDDCLAATDWTKNALLSQLSADKYVILKEQAFLEIKYFKIFLEDETELIIDARGAALWPQPFNPAELSFFPGQSIRLFLFCPAILS